MLRCELLFIYGNQTGDLRLRDDSHRTFKDLKLKRSINISAEQNASLYTENVHALEWFQDIKRYNSPQKGKVILEYGATIAIETLRSLPLAAVSVSREG